MLLFSSALMIAIGLGINRLSNRYFRRYGEQFFADPEERMFFDMMWLAITRYPPVVLALLGYFFGLYIVGAGVLLLFDAA